MFKIAYHYACKCKVVVQKAAGYMLQIDWKRDGKVKAW